MSKIVAFLRDDSGAAAAEYVLILAIIGSGIAAAAFAFGGAISDALGTAATNLDTAVADAGG
jgi:pilus assembly protein Flp/PilA